MQLKEQAMHMHNHISDRKIMKDTHTVTGKDRKVRTRAIVNHTRGRINQNQIRNPGKR